MPNKSVAFGYACLGLLIGILSGLTSGPIASALLAAIFTFVGGAVGYLLGRKPDDRHLLGVVLSSFAALCTIGLLVGIVIKDNRLLSFRNIQQPQVTQNPLGPGAAATKGISQPQNSADSGGAIKGVPQSCEGSVYLKEAELNAIDAIDLQYANGEISAEKAYRQLWTQVRQARDAGVRR